MNRLFLLTSLATTVTIALCAMMPPPPPEKEQFRLAFTQLANKWLKREVIDGEEWENVFGDNWPDFDARDLGEGHYVDWDLVEQFAKQNQNFLLNEAVIAGEKGGRPHSRHFSCRHWACSCFKKWLCLDERPSKYYEQLEPIRRHLAHFIFQSPEYSPYEKLK